MEKHDRETGIRGCGRSLSIASAIMMGSVLLSRILGIVREQVLAAYAGTSPEMDAYVTSFLIPEFLNHLLASGFMSVTFIPIFQKYLVAGDERRAWKVFSNLMTIGTALMVGFIVIGMVFAGDVLGLMGRTVSSPAQLTLTGRLTRIILPSQLFFYWGALLMAVQFARQRFLFPALAGLVYNFGIIAGGVVLYGKIGIEGFSWGVLGGALIGSTALQVYGARRAGMRYRFCVDLRDPDLYKYIVLTLPLMLGLGMQFSNEVLFRFFGSYIGPGSIASLNYSCKTMWVLVGVFGQAFGVASYPFLSRLVAEGKMDEMNRLMHNVLARLAALLIPFTLVAMVLAREIIALLFERGKFDGQSTALTASVLVYYLIGAFSFGATTIAVRGFYAMQNTILPMVVSTVTVVFSIPCYFLVLPFMGAQGIALVSSLFVTIHLAVLLGIWTKRNSSRHELKNLVVVTMKIVIISTGGAMFCFWLRHLVAGREAVRAMGTFSRNLVVAASSSALPLGLIFILFDRFGLLSIRQTFRNYSNRRKGTPR